MVLKLIIRSIGSNILKIYNWSNTNNSKKHKILDKPLDSIVKQKKEIIEKSEIKETRETDKEVISLWDYLNFNDNTQAHHLVRVIGFEEWVDMEEIRRRIKELFGIDYKNERSLYPYIKTLVDCSLLEGMSAGGRRKWRKRELFFIKKKKEKKKILEEESVNEISGVN